MKKTEYVLASGNRGKLGEMSDMLGPLGFVVRPQSDWNVPQADETASTFIENALLKARNAVQHTGLPAIADDSGLVVPVLRGEPGIYSARYAGEQGNDRLNNEKLLDELKSFTGSERQAYFYCAMVLINSVEDPVPLIATAQWHGSILHQPRGDDGFGYDPIFAYQGSTLSSAELSSDHKHGLSHRGQAIGKLVKLLSARAQAC